jgi:HSP20 family molecular chaperone IbpA
MQPATRLLFTCVLLAAWLPVTAWSHDSYVYSTDWDYRLDTGPAGGNRDAGSLRLQRGVTRDGYFVRGYLDGLGAGDVEVFPWRNRLVVQIARGDRQEQYDRGARGVSRWQMRLRKQLRLPYDADWRRMTKSTNNGILEIRIPRRNRHRSANPKKRGQNYGTR